MIVAEFFKGRRRKAGCVALVISIMLTGLWLRSRVVDDLIAVKLRKSFHLFEIRDGVLKWESYKAKSTDYTQWLSRKARFRPLDVPFFRLDLDPEGWTISFRPLAIAMGLLSAYLILWKPSENTSSIFSRPIVIQ